MFNQQYGIRERMRLVDLAYAREADLTKEHLRAKAANKYGDKDRFQNITIPIVMPQVEAAVTYQASVFLTGVPLFGVVADPAYEDEALQLETVIDEQSTRGGWASQFEFAFRDGFKYNLGCVEVSWEREVTAAIETDLGFSTKNGKPKEVIWEGNCVKHRDMYNTFYDTRVLPSEIHKKGEFAGYTELMSRIQLKAFFAALPDKMIANVVKAFESGQATINFNGTNGGIQSYYVPDINPAALTTINRFTVTDWLAWAGISGADVNKIRYNNMYEVTTVYARILPSDFMIKVPAADTPQVWKFIFVNHNVLVYAERQTNAHNYIPMLFFQPLEDGLGFQTKSLADNVSPIQDITSALSNSQIHARRRAISDRVLYDPSRVTEAQINSANPSAKIPVRPAAYGQPLSEAVYAFPFRDDQSGTITQEIAQYTALGNMISGSNPVRQGQFVKGNKTQHEFQDVMANANGRDQLVATKLESRLFTPLKEILKVNILQFQGGISLFNRAKQQTVQIDPVALRKAVLNFKMSDGLVPVDKLINADTMQVTLQVLGSSPAIAAGYNIAPLFSYLMKTQGAHITSFEKSPEQQAYEQAVSQWQQLCLQLVKENKEIVPANFPPQPVPQQFGYDPKAVSSGRDVSQTAVSNPDQGAQ